MTGDQKKWLDDHPDYQIMGRTSGPVHFVSVMWLYGDGRTEVRGPNAPPQKDPGAFQVGKKVITEPGPLGGLAPL
jgi:hypothetical protein